MKYLLIASLMLVLGACQKDENKSNQAPANPAVNSGGGEAGVDGSSDKGEQEQRYPGYYNGVANLDGVWVTDCRPGRYLWNVQGLGAQPAEFSREIVIFGKDRNGSNTIRYIIEDSSEYDYDCDSEPNFTRTRLDLKGVYAITRQIKAEGNLLQLSITHTSCGGAVCGPHSNLSMLGIFPNDIRTVRVINNQGRAADLIFGSQTGPRQLNQDLTRIFKYRTY
ncbi:MAG: hypothetical protein AB7F59_00550 [Bdellovibrionales bacterium]